MKTFIQHTLGTAPSRSVPALEAVAKNFGMIPNIFGVLAESPSVVTAYLQMGELFQQTDFTPEEQQVISIAVSVQNKCTYCVAAHTFMARNITQLSDDNISALRISSALPDAKLEALAAFTRAVVRERGWVADSKEYKDFFAAGYSKKQVLEVIMGVCMKSLSNYVNHLSDTPLDGVFSGEVWGCSGSCDCHTSGY